VLFGRSQINHKAEPHITANYPFMDFIDLLNGNQLDVRLDLMRWTEAEHFLDFFKISDNR
jgi:hypothetical protein